MLRYYCFRDFSTASLLRLHRNVWHRMTAGDGYQPFGYDWPTIRSTMPEWANILEQILRELNMRNFE